MLGSTRVVFTVQVVWFIALVPALYVGANLAGLAGAAAAHVTVAIGVVLPIYVYELRRQGIAPRPLAAGAVLPIACGITVAFVALAAQRLIDLDVLALGVTGAALLAVLGIEARRLRSTADHLRTVVSSGAG